MVLLAAARGAGGAGMPAALARLAALLGGARSQHEPLAAAGVVTKPRCTLSTSAAAAGADGQSSSQAQPLHVCVVGSGPAGFYTVDRVGRRRMVGGAWGGRLC